MNLTKYRNRVTRAKALLFALVTAMVTSPAFASGSTDFDSSTITAKIVAFAAAAALILGAWHLGKWGLRAFGMLSGK